MAKLSSTMGMGPSVGTEEISRVDISPEKIRSMSDEEILLALRDLRGNREAILSKPKSPARSAKRSDPDEDDNVV